MLATITIIVTCRLIGFYCYCDLIGMMMMMVLLGIDICTYEKENRDVPLLFLLIPFVQCQARYIKRSEVILNLFIYPHKTI